MAKRRGNNEGSIQKTTGGRFRAFVSIGGRRLSKTFKADTDARKWIRDTQGQIEKGLTYDASRTKFGDWFADWLKVKATALREHTRTGYERMARRYIIPYLGNVKFKDLSPARLIPALHPCRELRLIDA